MDEHMPDLENGLEIMVSKTCRLHFVAMTRKLKSLGLHKGQPRLIGALARRDGQTHTQLAEELEVTPATITNMVKRMERAGFVVRKRDTEDERVSRVYLTDEGRAIKHKLIQRMKEINEQAYVGFSVEEKEQLRGLMARLQQNLRDVDG